jgi:hypothetical protein
LALALGPRPRAKENRLISRKENKSPLIKRVKKKNMP